MLREILTHGNFDLIDEFCFVPFAQKRELFRHAHWHAGYAGGLVLVFFLSHQVHFGAQRNDAKPQSGFNGFSKVILSALDGE